MLPLAKLRIIEPLLPPKLRVEDIKCSLGASGSYASIAEVHLGPVAQLGERCLRMAEVTSSSLVGSTVQLLFLQEKRARAEEGQSYPLIY